MRSLLGGGEGTIAVPLALAAAARIQERDWDDFLEDPTQLANGLRDFVDAVAPDGIPVCHDEVIVEQGASGPLDQGPHVIAALEATARLRQSLGDRVALVAVLPGPARVVALGHEPAAAAESVVELGKKFLAAGAEVLVIRDAGSTQSSLATLANIARFHQSLAVHVDAPDLGLPEATAVAFDEPAATAGVVLTETHLPRDVEFPLIEDWIDAVKQ